MDKNSNFSNYLVFFLFISTMFFHFLMKENTIINRTENFLKNTEIKKMEQLNQLENKIINSELDLKDFIEIKQNSNELKKNKTLVKDKVKITPIKIDKKIQSITFSKKKKISDDKNLFLNFKPLEIKKQKINEIKNTPVFNKTEVISLGKLILKTNKKFEISFKWPVKKNMHELIYKKMLSCLNAKTALLGDDQVLYSQKGILDKFTIRNNYSPILRLPNYSSVKLENDILNNVKKKYPQSAKGKLIRLFDKNVDAYILGQFKILAKSRFFNFKKISGVYSILNNNLFVINLSVDDIKIAGKINLSVLNKGC